MDSSIFISETDTSSTHYRDFAFLSSVKWFAECFFSAIRQISSLPSAKQKPLGKKTLVKKTFCRVFYFFDTRQIASLPSVFLTLAKKFFWRVFFLHYAKDNLKTTFWCSKLIQMKSFSITDLYNSSRRTIYILIISSYDKIKVNFFINLYHS